MSTLNENKVPLPKAKLSKFDLSADHATSLSFMRVQPIYYANMVTGQSIDLNVHGVIRPQPLLVPTFGRVRANIRAFFVPYRLAFPQYDSFLQDVIGSGNQRSSLVSSPPILEDSVLSNQFQSVYLQANTQSTEPVDFVIGNTPYHFKPNAGGRHAYKILRSLGYDLLWSQKPGDFTWNALSLLCYAKVILDWYTNSNYLDSSSVLALQQALTYNDPVQAFSVDSALLVDIFHLIDYVGYDSNGYFEQAFDQPLSPTLSQFTPLTWVDNIGIGPAAAKVNVGTAANGTPYMYQQNASQQNIGDAYMHQMLERITSYQRRHALAGSLAIDRFLASHGRVTDHLRSLRSIYCGYSSFDVDIKSVFATANGSANGEDSRVGDYAGAGFGQGSTGWKFTAEEDGILLVLASVLPSGGYYQGYDRANTRIEKTEFFTPEYDGTVQSIQKGEVYISKDSNFASGSAYKGVFGYIGRYAELKRGVSRVTGDILIDERRLGSNPWHLMRDLDGYWNSIVDVSHSLDFTRGFDGDTYNRIFTYDNSIGESEAEPFYGFFHVDAGSYAPMCKLFDMFDFEEDGKDITIARGAKLN